jgi:hypothetical protein
VRKKLLIVHFQPVEGYPPVMNVINSMENEGFETVVFTTHQRGGDWFKNKNTVFHRLGKAFGTVQNRYFCYLQFGLIGFVKLLKFKPNAILMYESYSVLPVFLYSLISPKTFLFIHYHEFESKQEKQVASRYSKWLYYLERRLISKAIWVSQTNSDRILRFQELHPNLRDDQLRVFPNNPSRNWVEQGLHETPKNTGILKFIHVGSLGMKTTHVESFIQWIQAQKGTATLTIVSQNIELEVEKLIENNQFVKLIRSVPYQELPTLIIEHHIGVVLYNGHIPNYIFNVPNKVNEYLACGLNVWFSDVLISTQNFAQENPGYPLFALDFSKGIQMDAPAISQEKFEFRHWHEDAVKPLIDALQTTLNDSVHTN